LIIFNISLKILFLKILGKEEKEKKSEFIKDAQNGKKEFAQNDSSPFGSLVKKFMSSPDFEVKGLNEKQVAKAQKNRRKAGQERRFDAFAKQNGFGRLSGASA